MKQAFFWFLAAAATAPSAWGADYQIDSETIGQGYQLIGGDSRVISRRRMDQYLGINVWNIGGKDAWGEPKARSNWYFTSSLRLDFEIGDYVPYDIDRRNVIGARNVGSEISTNKMELLYAYAGARDLGGIVDLKIGRQIDFNLFEYMSWDGVSVEVKTPWFVAAEVYGGLLVNNFLPFDSAIMRPDGTSPGLFSQHDQDPKWLTGFNVRAFGFRNLDARFSYRQVWSPSPSVPVPAGTACEDAQDIRVLESCSHVKDGTTEHKLGFQARYRLLDGMLIPWAGFRYDIINGLVDTIEAGARATLNEHHSLQAEYVYSYPTFDGDSIWNVFARSRFDDLRLSYDVRYGRLRGWARGLVRFFHPIDEPVARPPTVLAVAAPGGNLDYGGNLGARYDVKRGWVRIDGYTELGYGGSKIGVDLASRIKVYEELVSVEGRLTLVDFTDDSRTIDSGTSFGFQVGGRLALIPGMLLHLLFEDNINHFYSSQLRVYAMLDVSMLLGSGGFGLTTPKGIGPGLGQFGSPYGNGMGY